MTNFISCELLYIYSPVTSLKLPWENADLITFHAKRMNWYGLEDLKELAAYRGDFRNFCVICDQPEKRWVDCK